MQEAQQQDQQEILTEWVLKITRFQGQDMTLSNWLIIKRIPNAALGDFVIRRKNWTTNTTEYILTSCATASEALRYCRNGVLS